MTLAALLTRALGPRDGGSITGDLGEDEVFDEGTPAAVLIGVVDRPVPTLLLTQRTETLRAHAGQVAFPGGRIDPDDADAVAAALREAEEEVALPRGTVTVVGTLDPYRTVTGYAVTPVLGIVPPDLPLRAQADEVAAIFEVPLAFATDAANQRRRQAEYRGRTRHYYEILWEGRRIWGATAAMIVDLGRRLAHG